MELRIEEHWQRLRPQRALAVFLFYQYVVLDIFSRYVVGWMLAERESSALASQLIERTSIIYNIQPGQLTLHADCGSSMRSTLVAQLLGELFVENNYPFAGP